MTAGRAAVRAERLRALGVAPASTRAARLAARLSGRTLPRFDDLAAIAFWRLVPASRTDELADAAALLFHRPQIDRSVDGAALRAIARRVGEALFDAACDAPLSSRAAASSVSQLPHANHYRDIGSSLIRRAERGDARVARLLDQAAGLLGPA